MSQFQTVKCIWLNETSDWVEYDSGTFLDFQFEIRNRLLLSRYCRRWRDRRDLVRSFRDGGWTTRQLEAIPVPRVGGKHRSVFQVSLGSVP